MYRKSRDPRDPQRVLTMRRHQLTRLLNLDAPDIIIYNQMRLVMKSQRRLLGRDYIVPHPKLWPWLRLNVNMVLDRLFPSRLKKYDL